MLLTYSFETTVPQDLLARYEWAEVRNASTILAATNPDAWRDIVEVLRDFELRGADLLLPGGNEGAVAARLNEAFRVRGWREGRVDTVIRNTLVIYPFAPAGERETQRFHDDEPVEFEGYKADWMNYRVAGDVEWNAKDGNLDRDLASYRSLYDTGYIDGAVLVTRTQQDLRDIESILIEQLVEAGPDVAAEALSTGILPMRAAHARLVAEQARGGRNVSRLGTSTTTNLPKLVHRLKRGDGGGCPILAVAVSEGTWDGQQITVGGRR